MFLNPYMCYYPIYLPPSPLMLFKNEQQKENPQQLSTTQVEIPILNQLLSTKVDKTEVQKEYNGDWGEILRHLKDKKVALKVRKDKNYGPPLKRRWTIEEDKILLENYEQYGDKWKLIAQSMFSQQRELELPQRNSKQVRDRFINQLNPQINWNKWTDEEDQIILSEYAKVGPRWAMIKKLLKNRSENQVKIRFFTCLKKNYKNQLCTYLEQQ